MTPHGCIDRPRAEKRWQAGSRVKRQETRHGDGSVTVTHSSFGVPSFSSPVCSWFHVLVSVCSSVP